MGLPGQIIIFDTEYTAWEGSHARGWNAPGEYKEIIQIGAVHVDTTTWEELGAFLVHVKPVKNPVLSLYIMHLTHITQAEVDNGLTLSDALKHFNAWSQGLPLYSFGSDPDVLQQNATLLGKEFPIQTDRFYDIREVFWQHGYKAQQSGRILEEFGKTPLPGEHNAIGDVRNIIAGLRELAAKNTI